MSTASKIPGDDGGLGSRFGPIAGTLLALLLALLAPLSIRYLEQADRARAFSDSRMLGRAVLAFRLDTGIWPVDEDADPETGELSRIVGLPRDRIEPEAIPGGEGSAGGWRGDANARVGAIEDHLIWNRSGGPAPIYRESAAAPDEPGWNGPYLESVPLDPWGHPYVCNTRYLEGANLPDVTPGEVRTHAVFCMSAGPDGLFESPLADGVRLLGPVGDDLGWAIQPVYVP